MDEGFSFDRKTVDDLILVSVRLGNTMVELVLDTGASHTFIDFGILVKEGYRMNDSKGIVPVETANGIILANLFEVHSLEALGLNKRNFEVTSYLFDDPEGSFKGVIGLDFLEGKEFCISLKENKIRIG
jgi:predicted aspartyl protease